MPSLHLRASVLWFVLAVSLGLYMGAAQDFRLVHVHVHLNLLGWVTSALIGLIWTAYPRILPWRLALLQFGLHNVGLSVFMGGIAVAQLTGHKPFAVIAGGSCAVGLGVLIFAVQVLRHVPRSRH